MLDRSAPEGKELAYARPERERRFLFAASPQGHVVRRSSIVDRYLPGTRLRLRQVTDTAPGDDGRTTYKLTQKVPGPDGGPGLITTLYLMHAEYALLREIPAATLRKTRFSIPPLGVDVFQGGLAGLVLAEVVFDDDGSMADFRVPADAVAEVTRDRRLSGGELATVTGPELSNTLREYGIDLGRVGASGDPSHR